MTASVDSWESSTPMPTAVDVETSRLHHRIRIELIRLLSDATPLAWSVVDGTRCTAGSHTVELDIAVRPIAAAGPLGPPLLCIDVHASGPTTQGAQQRARRRSLAQLGIDHYWSLDTATRELDVWVRTDDEYRHAETLTDDDWLDYGIGLIHLDIHHLLEA